MSIYVVSFSAGCCHGMSRDSRTVEADTMNDAEKKARRLIARSSHLRAAKHMGCKVQIEWAGTERKP
jgi:hypothetical protein